MGGVLLKSEFTQTIPEKINYNQWDYLPQGVTIIHNHPNVSHKSTFPQKHGSEKEMKFSLEPCPKHFGRPTSPKIMFNHFILAT